MIPSAKFKTLLSTHAELLSEEDIEQLRAEMYQLADIGFDLWEKDNILKGGKNKKDNV